MNENELKILQTAILNEVEGETFYLLAAEKADQPDIRDTLLHLAGEEKKHQQMLRNMLSKAGQPDMVDYDNRNIVSPGIFNLEEALKLKNVSNLEISAISIGIMMEKASVDYYLQAAAEVNDAMVKKLCEYLAAWEVSHLDELEKIHDYLRQAWFEQQGFSPA